MYPFFLFYFNYMTGYYFSTRSQTCLDNRADSPLLMNSKAILWVFFISFKVLKLYLLYNIQTLTEDRMIDFFPAFPHCLSFVTSMGFTKIIEFLCIILLLDKEIILFPF